MDEFFKKKMQEIRDLQGLKYIAWDVIDDGHTSVNKIVAEDVTGKILELPFPTYWLLSPIMNVLITTLLSKIDTGLAVVMPFDVDEIAKGVNEARKQHPYTGDTNVNPKASKYDYVAPEIKF